MRDIALVLLIFGSVPFIFKRPFLGVLIFACLGYLNPHKLVWSFAAKLPFSQVVGGTTMLAWLFNKNEPKKPPACAATYLWIAFICWMIVTTLFAIMQAEALVQLEKVLKIQIFAIITVILLTNWGRVRAFVWCVVLSLGFYGVKGGTWVILTGGSRGRVWGPEGTFIQDNNALALALLMILPLMYFLYRTEPRRWIRIGLVAGMVLTAFSVAGSFSRGAIVGGVCMTLLLIWRSRNRFSMAIGALVIAAGILSFMPQSWFDRAGTIETYQEDQSAMKRINAWTFAWRLAADNPVLGGGFEVFQSYAAYDRYAPRADLGWIGQDAHSIYFEVLAEHGFVGLVLFFSFFFAAWRSASRVISWSKRFESTSKEAQAGLLAGMLQASLVAYAAGGAFQGLSYFDLPYNIAGLAIVMSARFMTSSSSPAYSTDIFGPRSQGNIDRLGQTDPRPAIQRGRNLSPGNSGKENSFVTPR
jgi:probable O-glycosylation ligase (exosortase A-associated)